MSTQIQKDYFDWHYKICSFYLLIPPKNVALQVPYWIVSVPHVTLICIAPFLEGTKLFLGGSGEFSLDILNLGITTLHFMAVNRVARWFFIKKDYEGVLEKLRNINLDFSFFNYSNVLGARDPKYGDVAGRKNPIEEYQAKINFKTNRICRRNLICILWYVGLNISISYPLHYHLTPVYQKWNPTLNKTSLYRDNPYPLYYPFDTSISDGYYWLAFLYQPYAFFTLMCSFCCVDHLGIGTIIHLISHVKVMGHALICVDKNIDPFFDHDEVIKLKEKRLITCLRELQKIYECAKMLDKVFSSQLLIQELSMAILLCCAVYRVTSVQSLVEIGYLTSMIIVLSGETFILSWYSQSFTLEIFELLNRVYELDWINYPPYLRKTLVFLMQRLQTPFYFTMANWQPIDLSVFSLTIKTSYSFYTLISQTASKLRKSDG